jgi:Uma2 family endonuclease
MTELRRHHRYTYAEYVALETVSAEKHEFFDGEIYLMAGGSEEHSALAAAMIAALHVAVRGLPCRVHTSDLRMFVESVGLATYPDASVICGPLQQHPASANATALNPSILVEVTSDSSEEYDTGAKLEYYQTIPSLREYVIVSHRERRVTVYMRESDGSWTRRDATTGGSVAVPSLNAQLSVDDVYRNSAVS